jgi:hypothetical protein
LQPAPGASCSLGSSQPSPDASSSLASSQPSPGASQPFEGVSQRNDISLISHAVQERLVEWFLERPFFYDQSQRQFKNRGLRDRQLTLIGLEVGLTAQQVFSWFRSMRTMYGKLLKKSKSGQAKEKMTDRQSWLLHSFTFLDSHLRVQGETRHLGEVSIVRKNISLYYISIILV